MRPELILIFESKPATNFSTLNPKEQYKRGCPKRSGQPLFVFCKFGTRIADPLFSLDKHWLSANEEWAFFRMSVLQTKFEINLKIMPVPITNHHQIWGWNYAENLKNRSLIYGRLSKGGRLRIQALRTTLTHGYPDNNFAIYQHAVCS